MGDYAKASCRSYATLPGYVTRGWATHYILGFFTQHQKTLFSSAVFQRLQPLPFPLHQKGMSDSKSSNASAPTFSSNFVSLYSSFESVFADNINISDAIILVDVFSTPFLSVYF